MVLLNHFKGNMSDVLKCLSYIESEGYSQLLGPYQSNFMILTYLGYCKHLFHWKVMKVLEKSNNKLELSILRLDSNLEIQRKEKEIRKEIRKKTKNSNIEMLEKIPQGCEFLIDGFNAVRTNKHFKKLTTSAHEKSRLEAVLRLKILVETMAPGYLVLDKKFLDDAAEKEIL